MSIQQAIQERIAELQTAEQTARRLAEVRYQMEVQGRVAEVCRRIGELVPNDLQSAFSTPYLGEGNNVYVDTAEGVLPRSVRVYVRVFDGQWAGIRMLPMQFGGEEIGLAYDTPEVQRRNAVLDMLASTQRAIAAQEEKEAQRDAQRAAAEAEDAEAWPAFEAAKAAALAAADQAWPDGVEVTLYRWRWCTAPASDTDAAEYEDAWSLHDTLQDGWLQRASINVPIRITEASLPTVERYTLRSAEDARNADLGWRNSIAVPGFEFYMFDGKRYLRRLEPETIYLDVVQYVMPEWLKKLVQAAAAK